MSGPMTWIADQPNGRSAIRTLLGEATYRKVDSAVMRCGPGCRLESSIARSVLNATPRRAIRARGRCRGRVRLGACLFGRIDLCLTVRTAASDPGPIEFALADVIRPILLVRAAMVSSEYAQTFGHRVPMLRRRFDWAIAVSTSVNVASGGAVSWQDALFAGSRPPRAGTRQQAFCPPGGYGAKDLRNWRSAGSPERLVRLFLRDFLQQNGFHGVGPAVDETLDRLNRDPQKIPPSVLRPHR